VGLKLINLVSQAAYTELTTFRVEEEKIQRYKGVAEDEVVASVALEWEPLDLMGKIAAVTEFFDKFRAKWGKGMFDDEITEEEMVTLASLVKIATVAPGQIVVKVGRELHSHACHQPSDRVVLRSRAYCCRLPLDLTLSQRRRPRRRRWRT
jgi:hypothetical protein